MDQIKIGKFIQEKRKEHNITQTELADKLGITDRAVSKWENGVCLPDSGIMQELCSILNITINDLFSGEVVKMKENEKMLEKNLLEMTREKEESDKRLLFLEIVMGVAIIPLFVGLILLAGLAEMPDYARALIIGIAVVFFFIFVFAMVRIEQVAGYYECGKCNHKYVPSYSQVLWAMHMGRTRYMECPKCGKKSWQKKVLTK